MTYSVVAEFCGHPDDNAEVSGCCARALAAHLAVESVLTRSAIPTLL